jgi:hypothetical protein
MWQEVLRRAVTDDATRHALKLRAGQSLRIREAIVKTLRGEHCRVGPISPGCYDWLRCTLSAARLLHARRGPGKRSELSAL